jgi:hypothetical protein
MIDIKWLESMNACSYLMEWFKAKKIEEIEAIELIKMLADDDQWDLANWLMVRVMNYSQYVSIAVFASEQVIDIFHKYNSKHNRPQEAIEAAKRCICDLSLANKKAAKKAAVAAAAAISAGTAAASSAWAAAVNDADAAAAAIATAISVAAVNVDAANDDPKIQMRRKIMEYGIALLDQRASYGGRT